MTRPVPAAIKRPGSQRGAGHDFSHWVCGAGPIEPIEKHKSLITPDYKKYTR